MVKIEYAYMGQHTYLSYHNAANYISVVGYLENLVEGRGDTEIAKVSAIKIPLVGSLWISMVRGPFRDFQFHLMVTDYPIGQISSFKNMLIVIRELGEFNGLANRIQDGNQS